MTDIQSHPFFQNSSSKSDINDESFQNNSDSDHEKTISICTLIQSPKPIDFQYEEREAKLYRTYMRELDVNLKRIESKYEEVVAV